MNIVSLFSNIRFYTLVFSLILSFAIYFYVANLVSNTAEQIIFLTQYYALTAVIFLYFALLPDGLASAFPNFPFRAKYTKARRAIGVSTFYFALLHGSLAFFGELGGFGGLPFLDIKYLLAISLSFCALIILFLMAATSFDYWVKKLTFAKWKLLHRFVYAAGIFIVIHALMLGSHFSNLSALMPQIFTGALIILLLLEAARADKYLSQKFFFNTKTQTSTYPQVGVLSLLVVLASGIYLILPFASTSTFQLFSIHSQHIQLAKDAAQLSTQTNLNLASYLQGDRTKRYTVSFLHPEVISTSSDAQLQFLIFDASNGNPVNFFTKVYEKPLHLIIVDDSLQFFTHIHPTQIAGGFEITTQFPHPGGYHLYQNFQPIGAIEQQTGFSLKVLGSEIASQSSQLVDNNLTKSFGDYEVTLSLPQNLKADLLSIGNQTLVFTINNAKTHQPITTLKPYLAAFGHLVMINQKTYDYIHVHPANLTAPAPDNNGGPKVEFLPLGLYSPIKPGIYRLFAQFNPDNNLFTADFTIKID